jgi:hypothetical protein
MTTQEEGGGEEGKGGGRAVADNTASRRVSSEQSLSTRTPQTLHTLLPLRLLHPPLLQLHTLSLLIILLIPPTQRPPLHRLCNTHPLPRPAHFHTPTHTHRRRRRGRGRARTHTQAQQQEERGGERSWKRSCSIWSTASRCSSANATAKS